MEQKLPHIALSADPFAYGVTRKVGLFSKGVSCLPVLNYCNQRYAVHLRQPYLSCATDKESLLQYVFVRLWTQHSRNLFNFLFIRFSPALEQLWLGEPKTCNQLLPGRIHRKQEWSERHSFSTPTGLSGSAPRRLIPYPCRRFHKRDVSQVCCRIKSPIPLTYFFQSLHHQQWSKQRHMEIMEAVGMVVYRAP